MHFYRKNDHPLLKQFINSIILRRARIQIKYIQQYNYFYNIFLNKNYINSFFIAIAFLSMYYILK